MTGGGFGGSTVSLVRRDAAEAIARIVTEHYLRRTGRAATAFTSRPVDGARVMKAPHGVPLAALQEN